LGEDFRRVYGGKLVMKKIIYTLVAIAAFLICLFSVNQLGKHVARRPNSTEEVPQNVYVSKSKPIDETVGKSLERKAHGFTVEALERIKKYDEHGRKANASINFYGRVLDQYNNGVHGVRVEVGVSGYNESFVQEVLAGAKNNESKRTSVEKLFVFTDESGFFSITNKRGQSLRVISLQKEGFIRPPYDEGGDGYIYKNNYGLKHRPNPQDPVVYLMWKREGLEEGIISYNFKKKLDRAGTPIAINLLEGKVVRNFEEADILVSVKSDIPQEKRVRKYDWKLTLRAINGGLIETNDNFLFLAPDEGYQEFYEVSKNKDEGEWVRRIHDQKMYFKGRQGSIYAALRFTAYTYHDGHGYIKFQAVVNPNGSRNLEYGVPGRT
jgi:hypothetical protein